MEETLKDMLDELGARIISVDEPFQFHCTKCGACCVQRDDIFLNAKDVFNLLRKKSPSDGFGRG